MPMLSPVLARRKCRSSSPCQDPSLPHQIINENRGIFRGVSTLKWGQNGPVLEENGTFFGKFWIDPNKIRTFDRSNQKLARFFMFDSWHTRLFKQEHMRNTARIFRKSEPGFEHRVTQRLRIGQASGRCSQRELKIGRKDSTNVRHTVIARDAKDPNALCSQSCYRYWDRPSEVT